MSRRHPPAHLWAVKPLAGGDRRSLDTCLIGYGRVGKVTALVLSRDYNVDVVVFDASGQRVNEARRRGLEARLADVSNPGVTSRIAAECDVVAVALPSRVAERVVQQLIEAEVRAVVDVSYVADPLAFHKPALERGVRVFVDSGLAPGLSNMLARRARMWLDKASRIVVYVGGISAEDDDLFGLVASWSIDDLIEEYTRKAKARIAGEEKLLDPIWDAVRVELPGLGEFDAMPTDGLRTLLRSLQDVPTLIEYTLRYPGHVELLKSLHRLGLLDDKPHVASGCAASPRKMLVRLLEERLPKSGDRVVMYVEAEGEREGYWARTSYVIDVTQDDVGVETPVLTYMTGLVHAWVVVQALKGYGHPGVNAPEELAQKLADLEELLESKGIHVHERRCYEQ